MHTPDESLLGKTTVYASHYNPDLLFPIERAPKRAELGIAGALPFYGADIWNAYELSWLDAHGKPHVALLQLAVPAASPCLIESKSLKLYLNGFAGERLDAATLRARITTDLLAAAGAPVDVQLVPANHFAQLQLGTPAGECIDDLDLAIDCYGPPRADFLAATGGEVVEETLVSHLLKSNCPVTGQPDWGSVQISYRGPRIDCAGLLRYLVSFREHNEFHEQCVERIFVDLTAHCAPQDLSVYARYTRRGGLDINPFRSTQADAVPNNTRWARQ
ncbi:MAG TPA: NADPH-dependent 7-cyano-7-deazaguanine reductase QueF [Rhodanobacteraceae bacterium]